ncbi:homocysteine S-methyltransferase family protein [Pikeienuella piscinae]
MATILDGGMGQELIARAGGVASPLWATDVMMNRPELVRAVHDDYFRAGAEVATVNSYAILRDRLAPSGLEYRFEALHLAACRMAVEARDAHGAGLVAGSLGPIGASYRPELAPLAEEAARVYAEIAAIQAPYVDFFICETMASVEQARGAVLGASEAGKPVWLAVTVDDDNGARLRSGEPVEEVLAVVEALAPAALLVNCSTPEAVSAALRRLSGAPVPLGAYANGFTRITEAFKADRPTVDALKARTDLGPEAYLGFAREWVALGATLIGGCCEVGPAHIRLLAETLK